VVISAADSLDISDTSFTIDSVPAHRSVTRKTGIVAQQPGVFTLNIKVTSANAEPASQSATLPVRTRGKSDRTLTIYGGSSSKPIDYQFAASGSVERSAANGATVDPGDLVVENMAYGRVEGGADSYRFSGDLTTFDINRGSVTVTIDGDEANIDDLIAEPEGSGDLPNLISISGRGPDGPLDYQFSVSGEVEHDRANDATIDPEDLIAGGTAYGQVEGGTDSYRYSGDITAFDVDQGDTTVLVNGEETDISALPPEPTEDGDLPNVITIDDESRDGPLEYQFEVSGELSHSTANSATIDPGDLVVGTTAYGLVNGGRDSFRFSGQVADFAIDQGKRRVLVNGNEVENPEGKPS
jgi:hypothetical protein